MHPVRFTLPALRMTNGLTLEVNSWLRWRVTPYTNCWARRIWVPIRCSREHAIGRCRSDFSGAQMSVS